jgi:hypothetical protein
VTADNFEKIQDGMSEQEVRALLALTPRSWCASSTAKSP